MRILHVEDNSADAELIAAVIREEWPECEIDVVEGREQFVTEISSHRYDLILSDFSLSSFDGLTALHLAREGAPDTPFIFLSGTIGEDRAVEAMRLGAADYVLKDRPKRLIPAIRRAVVHAERVREQRATEAQLLRVQRLENIGALAAGIAHDFNNVLAPVLLGIPLVREHVADPGMNAILSNMETSVRRGATLVQQILGFARGSGNRTQLVQAKHVIRELLDVIAQTFPKKIHLEDQVEGELWLLETTPTHLHQLLLNLCVNARDAMPQGGRLSFKAANRHIMAPEAAAIPGLQAGRYVVFEVADTGIGIPAENLARIWEPFFITKENGGGTGLGLSTVRRITSALHGAITVQSTPGSGTKFTIYLPAAAGHALTHSETIDTSAPRGNNELVLIVDDDQNVRLLAAALLNRHGYRTLVAGGGVEAVALFTTLPGEVRVVITDLGMQSQDGFTLASVVRGLDPAVRILAISGLPDAESQMRAHHLSHPILTKPFTADTLLQAVHRLLSTQQQPAQGSS
jgi:two-component system cell cycle sensor histidine kinase/response regulator CckA